MIDYKSLIRKGLDVNTKEGDGYSPLVNALRKGNKENVKLLLYGGATIDDDALSYTEIIAPIIREMNLAYDSFLEAERTDKDYYIKYNIADRLADYLSYNENPEDECIKFLLYHAVKNNDSINGFLSMAIHSNKLNKNQYQLFFDVIRPNKKIFIQHNKELSGELETFLTSKGVIFIRPQAIAGKVVDINPLTGNANINPVVAIRKNIEPVPINKTETPTPGLSVYQNMVVLPQKLVATIKKVATDILVKKETKTPEVLVSKINIPIGGVEIKRRRIDYGNSINLEIRDIKTTIERNKKAIKTFKSNGQYKDDFYRKKIEQLIKSNQESEAKIVELTDKYNKISSGLLDKEINTMYTVSKKTSKNIAPSKPIKKPLKKKFKEETSVATKDQLDNYYSKYTRADTTLPKALRNRLKILPSNKGFIWKGVHYYGEKPFETDRYKNNTITPFMLYEQRDDEIYIHEYSSETPKYYKIYKKTQ